MRFLACLILLVSAFGLAFLAWDRFAAGLTGAVYPVYVTTATGLFLGSYLVQVAFKARPVGILQEAIALLPGGRSQRIRLVVFISNSLAYVVLLPILGFAASTVLFIVISVHLLGQHRPLTVISCTVVLIVIMEVLFVSVFYVSLPRSFIDDLISEHVYMAMDYWRT